MEIGTFLVGTKMVPTKQAGRAENMAKDHFGPLPNDKNERTRMVHSFLKEQVTSHEI